MESLAIVCVDDQRVVLDSLTEQIKRQLEAGWEVEAAESGEEALEIIEEFHEEGIEVALIIADQIMPGMKGDELLIKIHTHYPKILKIMLTGQANAQAVGNAVNAANLYRYIGKPWDETDLILTVKEALRSYIQDRQLAEQNKELQILNASLEQKVAERTQELSKTLDRLKETQNELIQSEKMAALGQLIAGVAHEVNTPLGVISSSVGNINDFLDCHLEELPAFLRKLSLEQWKYFLMLLNSSSLNTTIFTSKEKRRFKRQLLRQLDAKGIANSDVIADTLVDIGIYNDIEIFLPLFKDPKNREILEASYQFSVLQKSAQTIKTAADRAAKVVFALKSYTRHASKEEKTEVNIVEGIETVLTLYQNLLKHGIEVIKDYGTSPSLRCYPDELSQVWTNLIHNAVQAMKGKGKLELKITEQESQVLVQVTDSGCGIPPEIQDKIFDPFFTTKPEGEGSGLGLDIVQKIIEKHEGKIEVASIPGCTKFTIYLPRV